MRKTAYSTRTLDSRTVGAVEGEGPLGIKLIHSLGGIETDRPIESPYAKAYTIFKFFPFEDGDKNKD